MIPFGRREAAITSGLSRAARWLGLIGLLVTSLSACGSIGSPPGVPTSSPPRITTSASPLVWAGQAQGITGCLPAPDPAAGLYTWAGPVGFALDIFYNRSSLPLAIKSVSLIDPQNLVLHGGLAYEMAHSLHPLPLEAAWTKESKFAPAMAWKHRQAIPGAVIPPGHPSREAHIFVKTNNLYEIVVAISDATPAGGWALGEKVTYSAGTRTYTIEAKNGMAIGSARVPMEKSCDGPMTGIRTALGSRDRRRPASPGRPGS